ncbi:MAG: hypothetical protein U0797_04075 [Gemmataceae bacterium]
MAARPDALGRLTRVFQRMATEVQAREKRLKDQVAQLRIEIDMVKLTKQVEEVTQAPVFDSLLGARDRLKRRQADGGARGTRAADFWASTHRRAGEGRAEKLPYICRRGCNTSTPLAA